MLRKVVLVAGLLAALGGYSARLDAASILYYADWNVGTDRMAATLAGRAGDAVTTASSTADFASKLTAGNYDLAIFFEQNSTGSDYDAAFAALGTYIGNGGRAIATDWYVYAATHAAVFDTAFTSGTNQTSMTVTGALAAGLTNPVLYFNPGWGIATMGLSTLAGGSGSGTWANGDLGIVIGNGGRSIFNGFLADTFVDGAAGVTLYNNEIDSLLQPVPEPASGLLLALGSGLLVRLRRRR